MNLQTKRNKFPGNMYNKIILLFFKIFYRKGVFTPIIVQKLYIVQKPIFEFELNIYFIVLNYM